MPQKFIHGVSPELRDDAAYKTFASIEGHALTAGTTVKFFPGTYELGAVSLDAINIEGVGARESVVLCNVVATIANTVTIRNVTFSGNNASIPGTAGAALFITVGSNVTSHLKVAQTNFVNADFGVDNQGVGLLAFNSVDATGVDRFLRSNSVASGNISFSMLNTTSNAYFTAANAQLKAIQVRHSFSGGSNTGTTTKVVSANVA